MLNRVVCHLLISVIVPLLVVFGAGAQGAQTEGQWILVAPNKLQAAAKPLIERRQQQGWQVVVIDADRYSTADNEGAQSLRNDLAEQNEAFKGRTCILLLGSWIGEQDFRIPAENGTQNRMQRMLTDHGFGRPEPDGSLTVAVGRLPARSGGEATVMISKLLKFEARQPQINRVNLIVAHPGGRTELEKSIASNVIRTTVDVRLRRINSLWQTECIMDVPNSKFQVPAGDFGVHIKRMFERPHVFCVYSGHSSANGLYSSGGNIFPRDRFDKLHSGQAAGILVCCGCYGCQVAGFTGQGYGLAAIRSKSGPVAVIGAFGESYSAMGLLALDGLLNQTTTDDPPKLLGEYWLAVQHGITRGEIQPGEFLMHDMADGSQGRVPLEAQRREHAQMWTLLGDPAMRIPIHRAP